MIGSTEASIGIIRRCRSESSDLGYTFDFDAKTGFFPDDSTNCVSDNFECFKFLRSYQILRNGVTKTIIWTHETEQHALFNGVTSSSTINWDGFCLSQTQEYAKMILSAWVRMLNIKYVGRYDEVFWSFWKALFKQTAT